MNRLTSLVRTAAGWIAPLAVLVAPGAGARADCPCEDGGGAVVVAPSRYVATTRSYVVAEAPVVATSYRTVSYEAPVVATSYRTVSYATPVVARSYRAVAYEVPVVETAYVPTVVRAPAVEVVPSVEYVPTGVVVQRRGLFGPRYRVYSVLP